MKEINDERFSSNTNDTLITNNFPNETANSDIANVSLCKDNTLEFLNKVDQAESDKCNAKKTLTDENEPSTEENVQGELRLICNSICCRLSIISF